MARVLRPRFGPVAEDHSASSVELFFDLVFVFALTQITAFMAADPTWLGMGRALVMLALLWFGWAAYSWLSNQADGGVGAMRVVLMVAMAAYFVAALAIPGSYTHVSDGVAFAVALVVVRLLHVSTYLWAAGDDTGLRRQLRRTYALAVPALVLLLVGGALGAPWQTPLWLLAFLVDYAVVFLTAGATTTWRVNSAHHFAERHGLVVIIALGESLVAIGVGLEGTVVDGTALLVALAGLGVVVCLFWAYFARAEHEGAHALARAAGAERAVLARDLYTYLHFALVCGIVLVALGLKKGAEYATDLGRHEPGAHLSAVPLVALFGGAALFLAALLAFRRRAAHVGVVRPICGIALVVAASVPAPFVPALVAVLLLLAALLAAQLLGCTGSTQ